MTVTSAGWLLTVSLAWASQARAQDRSPHASDFVTVHGVTLHYLDWGGQGEAVLFLHGFPGSAHNFDEMAPQLTDRFRVLGLTRRGHGQSERIETGYDTDNLARDVRAFLDARHIKRANLIGCSAGGDELTRFATPYPERTIKLVFLDAAYDRRDLAGIEAQDPLATQDSVTTIEAAMIRSQDTFRPDYTKIKAPALSYYAITESHWNLTPGASEATRAKAREWIERVVQLRQWRNIEQFQREMSNGRAVVLRNTQHTFYRDPALKDRIVREVRQFLLGQ